MAPVMPGEGQGYPHLRSSPVGFVILFYNSKHPTRLLEGIPGHGRLRPKVLHFRGIYNILHLLGLFTHIDLLRKQEQDEADDGGNNSVL